MLVLQNTLCFSLGIARSMFLSFSLIGRMRGKLRFSGWFMLMVLCSRSMSVHCSRANSPMRAPVSLSICRSGAKVLPADAMNWSISVSVGMKYIFSSE